MIHNPALQGLVNYPAWPLFWARPVDFYICHEIFEERVYDDILPRGTQNASIIDLGANIGCAASWFMDRYPGARIFSVEPDRSNFDILECNLAATNTRVIRAAYSPKLTYGLSMVSPHYDSRPCALQTIDDARGDVIGLPIRTILGISGFEKIDLLKVDIEGAEEQLMSDGNDWLDKIDHVVCEIHQGNGVPLMAHLEGAGFEVSYRQSSRLIVAHRAV